MSLFFLKKGAVCNQIGITFAFATKRMGLTGFDSSDSGVVSMLGL